MAKPKGDKQGDKKELAFQPYPVTSENCHTAILLLMSKEPAVLCQTLRALTKFAGQDMANREIMFNMDAVKYIVTHIEHPETNIKRFALKALSQLCQLPQGPKEVLADDQNLRKVAFTLAKNEDVFVQEFSSLVLAELTKCSDGCEQLISANILASLFNRMKTSQDPDVQKNCLQTLSNLLDDPVCATEVTKNPQFNWPSLLALMSNKYLGIQHAALRTVDQLISRIKDENIQRSFKASSGLQDLCDILESYEFRDIHAQALSVLKTYVETEDNVAHLYFTGCISRMLTYLEMAIPAMKPHCIAVLTKMSFTENGRHALYESHTDLVFAAHLMSSNVHLLGDAAMGVANMTKMMASAIRMAETNIIVALGSILTDEGAPWLNVRINALIALAELCRIIPKSAFAVVEHNILPELQYILSNEMATPLEAQKLTVQCYINLLNYHVSLKAMLNQEFISQLIRILRRKNMGLKALVCKVLTGLMVEEDAKFFFSAGGGEAEVHANLKIVHNGLRMNVCNLIVASVSDDGADEYLNLGTIHSMVENKQARYALKEWELALNEIFRHHPSAKLAYCGRLDINDFTSEGFYVMKRMEESFVTIEDIMNNPPPHHQPIFITMFYPDERTASFDIRSPYRHSKSNMTFHSSSRMRFPPVRDDINLRTYLYQLKLLLGDPAKSLHYFEVEDAVYEVRHRDKCSEIPSTQKQRAQILAEFVAEQMNGTAQERDCSLPSIELHLADLALSLGSCIIGIGWVKCGGALERAVMYKVLADRLGIPCSLHRVSSAHAWCEVAVPDMEPGNEHLKPEQYPAGLLRANYLVDLMSNPPKLVHLGTKEAERIQGPKYTPMYVSRAPPVVCRCDKSTPCAM